MPASPSIQQMPEFAATMPSSPFPATAVAIITGCSEFKWLEWCSVETGHGRGQALSKKTAKLFIAQRFHGCHFHQCRVETEAARSSRFTKLFPSETALRTEKMRHRLSQ